MSIFIYQDYVHNNGILHRRLCEYFGVEQVRFCDFGDIIEGCLKNAALFVMPGGADLYHCEKLNSKGNAAIRHFVETGGNYLGICAGAYYACEEIEWAKNDKTPICGARELGFYKGCATGPIYKLIEDNDINKSWDSATNISFKNKTMPILYSGGPIFEGDKNAIIMARYEDLPNKPAAIVECSTGKGKAILSGPHIEHNADTYTRTLYKHLNSSFEWQSTVSEKLTPHNAEQNDLWHTLLGKFSIGKRLDHAA